MGLTNEGREGGENRGERGRGWRIEGREGGRERDGEWWGRERERQRDGEWWGEERERERGIPLRYYKVIPIFVHTALHTISFALRAAQKDFDVHFFPDQALGVGKMGV